MNYGSVLCFMLGLTIASVHVAAQDTYSLKKALSTARSNNPILKTEIFNVNSAQASITTSKLRPNPNLNNQSLQLVRNRYYLDNTSWNNPHNRQVWWQVTKPFQLPNQRKYKIDVAQKNFRFSEINYSETERNLFLDVANKWLDAWTAQKQLEIISIAKSNTDSLVKINQLRLKNQVISQSDVMRTELLADQYSIQLKQAQQESVNRYKELTFLLGIKDSLGIDMEDTIVYENVYSIDSLSEYGKKNRADLLSAEMALDITDSNIKLQKSLAYPQPVLGAIWNPQNTVPYLGFYGAIDIPIFSRNQGEIERSAILKQQVSQKILALQAQIETEITTSYRSFVINRENLQKFTSILKKSETILNNVRYAYLRGGTTIVDFLEAQRSWLETRQQYFDTYQQYRQSYIQVLYSTGLINQLAQ
ncbi:MAG TPA: TolC family protein [Cyclobacteriaceae bacterium]|nr:TolC family protein [Cyclobacteriaceae bacterium]